MCMTIISHPASGTRYQETDDGHLARIMVDGRMVVRPRRDTDRVYAGYRRLVETAINETEEN